MSLELSLHDAMLGAVSQLRAFAMKLCRNPDQVDDLVQEAIGLDVGARKSRPHEDAQIRRDLLFEVGH